MIPLMILLGQQSSGSVDVSGQVTPPGTVPSTCISGCTTPLPEIRNSSGDIVNIGDFWTEQGGYYSGLFTLTGNEVYALIISPASFGKIDNVNMFANASIIGDPLMIYLPSSIDGKKNTDDVINWTYANNQQNNYPLIKAVKEKRDLNYNGFNDYYIPSLQETILMHKYFKPDNLCTITNSGTTCTGQAVNTTNLYPCNICNLSTINSITVFNSFKETQSESFKTYLNSSISIVYFFFTSTRFNTGAVSVYGYKGSSVGYTNQIASLDAYYSPHTTTTRLVRRVLVS